MHIYIYVYVCVCVYIYIYITLQKYKAVQNCVCVCVCQIVAVQNYFFKGIVIYFQRISPVYWYRNFINGCQKWLFFTYVFLQIICTEIVKLIIYYNSHM